MMLVLAVVIYAVAYVVWDGGRAANPIWNELRSSLAVVVVLMVAGLFWTVT